jgi:hypothetical protein
MKIMYYQSMITITIENSYSKIKGLDAKQEKALKAELSYVVGGKASYYYKYGVKKRSLLGKKGDFPTGLLQRVMIWLISNRIAYKVNDLRVKP